MQVASSKKLMRLRRTGDAQPATNDRVVASEVGKGGNGGGSKCAGGAVVGGKATGNGAHSGGGDGGNNCGKMGAGDLVGGAVGTIAGSVSCGSSADSCI